MLSPSSRYFGCSVLTRSCPYRFAAPSDNPNNHTNNLPNKGVLRCHEAVRTVQGRETTKVDASTGSTFGELLRSYRSSASLTQEDLAARTGLTPQAMGLLERGERRRPHKHTVVQLAKALGLTGQDLARFEAAARRSSIHRVAAEPSHDALPTPATSLVGRDHEATSAARLLLREEVRLLTLTGPGGVGKTRLAVEVAGRSGKAFADGFAFVPLAPLRDVTLFPTVLTETLGIKEVAGEAPQETLMQHLRDRQMLLVLDNFEHLPTAALVVAALVGACPQLTVLVTSRAPLHLGGEHQFPVPPLPLPKAEDLASGDVLEHYSPAVKLFPPKALLDRLDRRLQLLRGGARDLPERQQTLHDAVTWSYDLLGAGEQALFRRLAVFAGGCSLEGVQREHAQYYLALAEAGQPDASKQWDEAEWWSKFTRLESEHDNLRAALGWAVQNRELETAAQLAIAMWWFWIERGYLSDGRRWMEAILAVDGAKGPSGGTPHALSARTKAYLLQVTGILAMAQGDHDYAMALHEEGMRVYRELGHKKGVSASLRELGFVAYEQGDYERAVRLHGQSLALARGFGTTFGVAWSLRALGDAVRGQGDLRRARALLEESLALSRSKEHAWGIARTLASLGNVACEAGEYTRASRLYEESLELGGRRMGLNHTVLVCLEGLARVAVAQGRMERAAHLFGTAAALREDWGWPLPPSKRTEHDRTVAAAHGALGKEEFTAVWTRGHALPLKEAIEDILLGKGAF